jgi:hypothetical protein
LQQRCCALEQKSGMLEHLSKLVQAVEERDAKLKEQVAVHAV